MPAASLLSDLAAALDRSLPVPLSVQLQGADRVRHRLRRTAARHAAAFRARTGRGGRHRPDDGGDRLSSELQQGGLIVSAPGRRAPSWPSTAREVARGADAGAGAPRRRAGRGRERGHISVRASPALLNARIGRGRAREGRGRPHRDGRRVRRTRPRPTRRRSPGSSSRATASSRRPSRPCEPAPTSLPRDLYITLANRRSEAGELSSRGRAPVTSVSFIPVRRDPRAAGRDRPAVAAGHRVAGPRVPGADEARRACVSRRMSHRSARPCWRMTRPARLPRRGST